ncbi:hypothetical protein NLU13_5766 [Sarocladium strictum]|uniref:Amino acid transporter transmembrane domain-containing protein n=1 Tax=Sarocladium strictum TaxID=5046 RepID=A0AA39L896_SARSR|nr:hypothetical protein NLU13_5766 [Sarocladium strictum]
MSDHERSASGVAAAVNDTKIMAEKAPANSGDVEVFAAGSGQVNFRTVGWVRAAIFLLKMTFGAGVLSLPAALYQLGAVAGGLFILFWGILNTYMALLQGRFKLSHPRVHTVADSAEIAALHFSGGSKAWAVVIRDITEVIYIITWILAAGLTTLGLSIAFNAVTKHGACSVIFGFCSYIIVASFASIRKIGKLAWISWIGFGSVVAAILTVLIATAIRNRPAAAPPTGDFDLGFSAWPAENATFASAWAASLIIFASSANTSGFVPVISEMKRPQDFFKSVYVVMTWITTCYMVIGMVMFRFAGKWLSSPALGSAGPTIKIISYGLAIPGLIAGAMICIHVAGKSIFVRLLRGSPHLTANTWQHWTVWLSSTYGTGLVGWLICEAVPFFGSLLTVVGALGFGPLGLCLPVLLWYCMNEGIWQKGGLKGKMLWVLHAFLLLLGLFVTIAGTYSAVVTIRDQYKSGSVGQPFQCADNSNTVASG